MRKLTKLLSALIVLFLATAFIGYSNPSSSDSNDNSSNTGTTTVTWDIGVFPNTEIAYTITKDGITLTSNGCIDCYDKIISDGGTFTTSLGKFTKIELTAADISISGIGWSVSRTKKTWTGDATTRVSFDGIIDCGGDYVAGDTGTLQIVFTIEE